MEHKIIAEKENTISKKPQPLIQWLEENNSLLFTIEKDYGFSNINLSNEIYHLTLFNTQIKITKEELSTPSKNKDKLTALEISANNLLSALARLSKKNISEIDDYLQYIKKNNSFIHSLEDKKKLLYDYLYTEKNREKYGKYNGNLILSTSIELRNCLSNATYPTTKEIDKALNLYIKLGEKKGLDFDIGKKLYGYMQTNPNLENFQAFIYKGIGLNNFDKSWIEMITTECAARYIEEGMITAIEIDNILARVTEHINKTSIIATLPEFVCITAKKSK